ncbi:MAG: hypothetical protein ACOY45_04460 [Pseudomonadota bacterium]
MTQGFQENNAPKTGRDTHPGTEPPSRTALPYRTNASPGDLRLLRARIADVLDQCDVLGLSAVGPHLDLALARLDELYLSHPQRTLLGEQ